MKVIEQKIRSLYHSTVFLWLLSAFFHIFSFSCVCLCRHFVCFSSVIRPRTQILSVFILAAILNKFPLSVDKSVTWFLLCARVFSPAAAILESEKTLGTRLTVLFVRAELCTVIFFICFLPYLQVHGLLSSRNFVTMATSRNDSLLLTVFKAHISKVYFVVVVFILHVFRLTAVKTWIYY